MLFIDLATTARRGPPSALGLSSRHSSMLGFVYPCTYALRIAPRRAHSRGQLEGPVLVVVLPAPPPSACCRVLSPSPAAYLGLLQFVHL